VSKSTEIETAIDIPGCIVVLLATQTSERFFRAINHFVAIWALVAAAVVVRGVQGRWPSWVSCQLLVSVSGESGRSPLSFPTSVLCATSVSCGGTGEAAARDGAKVGWHLLATWTPSFLDFDGCAANRWHGCLTFVEDSNLHSITTFM